MIAILDASAAVDVVLNPSKADAIEPLMSDAEWVLAPTLFVSEVTNVFWKYYTFHDVSMEVCEKGMARALALPDSFSEDNELQAEAFGMACLTRRSVYDMMYLVLARRHNGILLTQDRSLQQVARQHGVRIAP